MTPNTNQTKFFECFQTVKNVYIPTADCITWASHNVPYVHHLSNLALRGVTGADGQHEAMRLGMLAVRNAVDPANNAVAALGARADEEVNLEDLQERVLALAEKMIDDKLARVLPEMETRLMVKISNEIMEKLSPDMEKLSSDIEKLSNEMREMHKNATNNIQDGVTTLSNNVMNLINNKFEEMMQVQQSQNASTMQLSNIPGPIMQVANAMAASSSMPAAGTASGTASEIAPGNASVSASQPAAGLRKKKVARLLLDNLDIQSYGHVLPIIEQHLRHKKPMMLHDLAQGIQDEFNIDVDIDELRNKMSGATTMFSIADIMQAFNKNNTVIRAQFRAWNIPYRKRGYSKYKRPCIMTKFKKLP